MRCGNMSGSTAVKIIYALGLFRESTKLLLTCKGTETNFYMDVASKHPYAMCVFDFPVEFPIVKYLAIFFIAKKKKKTKV